MIEARGETVTILAEVRRKVGKAVRVDYSNGLTTPARPDPAHAGSSAISDDAAIKQAVTLVAGSDIAIVVLGEGRVAGGGARTSLDMPGRQIELLQAVIATGKPVVLLLINGRPLNSGGAMPQAVMEMWYPGTQGGAAAANLLFGEVSPGGKLPFTWPANVN